MGWNPFEPDIYKEREPIWMLMLVPIYVIGTIVFLVIALYKIGSW